MRKMSQEAAHKMHEALHAPFELDDQAIYSALHSNPAVKKYVKIERKDVQTDITGGDFCFEDLDLDIGEIGGTVTCHQPSSGNFAGLYLSQWPDGVQTGGSAYGGSAHGGSACSGRNAPAAGRGTFGQPAGVYCRPGPRRSRGRSISVITGTPLHLHGHRNARRRY